MPKLTAYQRAIDLIALAIIVLMLATAACIAWPVPALAADGTTVDFAPVITPVIEALFGVVAGLAGWAIRHLTVWLKLKQDSEVRRYLEDTCYAGIALVRARSDAALTGKLSFDTKSAMVAEVAQYLIDRVPGALKRFGLSDDALKNYVLARIGGGVVLPAADLP
ncbi:hypothetical protein [Zavarzinia aquatilis]|uniref:Uncharacterized protein n=1 Tax=Zavarzinia aquatilis TaxID=2211142 RepID=A0A317DSQ3_9PROT|nr:hypothetical protein [Zavarzinia aquatilis]PWR17691.1 hypothetical protein DKG74_20600 [Zavarzinia aquatilis]